jgi:hypothetical protein
LTTARFSAVYSRFSFVLVDREADCAVEGALRCFVPDADGCVSVADVKDVGSVVVDAEDDDPPEDREDEDEAASESIISSSLTACGVEKSANDFCANLRAEERLPAARCFWEM